MGKDNPSETAFGLLWQEKAGTPKGLIMPQNKCEGSAGEKYHRQDFWQRAVRSRARGNGEGEERRNFTALKPQLKSSVTVCGAGTSGEEPFPGEGTRGKQQLQPLRPRAGSGSASPASRIPPRLPAASPGPAPPGPSGQRELPHPIASGIPRIPLLQAERDPPHPSATGKGNLPVPASFPTAGSPRLPTSLCHPLSD